jgi:hypothetical protein
MDDRDRATSTLLEDRGLAARLGQEAHRRVRQDYLAPRRLTQELDLIQRLTRGAGRQKGRSRHPRRPSPS